MCKNHKHSSTPITDLKKAKSRRTYLHNCYRENKIPRNKTDKEYKKKTSSRKTTNHCSMKQERTQPDPETFHVLGEKESISRKWPYCPK